MLVARQLVVAAGLMSVLGLWAGCDGSSETHSGDAGSSGSPSTGGSGGSQVGGGTAGELQAQCPPPLADGKSYAGSDACTSCPGIECTGDGVTCQSGWHASGDAWWQKCLCVEGHVACCSGSKAGPWLFGCTYGSEAPPDCPSAMPLIDEACGSKPMVCDYPSSCCAEDGVATASCWEGVWRIDCKRGYADGTSSFECGAGAAGAAGASGAAGAHN